MEVKAEKNASRLSGHESDVRRAIGRLARELRVVLLSAPYLRALGATDPDAIAATGLLRGHLLFAHPKHDRASDTGWAAASLSHEVDDPFGARVVGPVGGVAAALADAGLAARAGGSAGEGQESNALRPRLGYEDLVSSRWAELTVQRSLAVAAAIRAGDQIAERVHALGPASVSGMPPALRSVAATIPAERLFARATEPRRTPLALSERLALGLALDADAGNGGSGPIPELERVTTELRAALAPLAAATPGDSAPTTLAALDAVGAPMPSALGRATPVLVGLPSFESLDHEQTIAALLERERIELRLAVIAFLGRHALPGELGADLYALALADPSRPPAQVPNDWEEGVRWTVSLGDEAFGSWLRELLRSGRYSPAF